MHLLVTVVLRILEIMFVVGLIGSAIVILLTGVEDIETVLEKEESAPPASMPTV